MSFATTRTCLRSALIRGALVMGVGLGVTLAAAPSAGAAPLTDTIDYYTSGGVGSQAGPSTGPIGLESGRGSNIPIPGAITLGTFVAPPEAAGESLTYQNVPFRIDFHYDVFNPDKQLVAFDDAIVAGNLSGTIDGHGHSTMAINVGQVQSNWNHPLPSTDFHFSPEVVGAPATGSLDSQSTALVVYVQTPPLPVPEPASASALVLAAGLLARIAHGRLTRRSARS